MIKYAIALLLSVNLLQAQDDKSLIQVGDVLEIGRPEYNTFKHINFPDANFIIKRGGIANYKKAEGQEVIVTSVKEKKNGGTEIKIKRNDGGRFFGINTVISADLEKALESGELQAR